MNWKKRSIEIIQNACTPWGIKASLTNLDNYGAIFTRDAVMAGIAGVLLKDDIIIEGLKNTLFNLKKLQGKQGQIASNFTIKEGKVDHVSFGTLSPKIDSCTWYLIGVGILLKEGLIQKKEFKGSVEKTINLLDALEYNGKHLIYVPKGGNWADEYIYEGYILYDQALRAWGLSLLALNYENQEWADKSKAILTCIEKNYKKEANPYFSSSFYPGGSFDKFDLAAHSIIGILLDKNSLSFEQSLEWILKEFISKNNFPPAFYPVIQEGDAEWGSLRAYHLFAFKNAPHHYHNGGIWWIWLGWLAISLTLWNKEEALHQLLTKAFQYLDKLENFDFDEYLTADSLIPNGTKNLCYTATGIIFMSLAQEGFDFSELNPSRLSLINEPLEIKPEYFSVSSELVQRLKNSSLLEKDKLVIGICGESGSGKSVTAKCLQIELEQLNIPSVILHQDCYYKLPPKDNHEKRKADISWVGMNEVKWSLLQQHIEQFKSHEENILVPIVDYKQNTFREQEVSIKNKSVLIIEGVYSFFLKDAMDYKVFMERTYQQTLEKRKARSREVYDQFVEQVLAIEHALIQPLGKSADDYVSENYTVKKNDK